MSSPGSIRAGGAAYELSIDPTYKRQLKEAEGEFSRFGERLDQIKQRFGRRGLMADIGELALGGGAIAGIGVLTSTFDRVAKSAADFSNKLRDGKTNAGDLAAEMAKSLPIIGSMASGLESVLDIFTGIKAETAKIYADVAAADKKMEDLAKRKAQVGGIVTDAEDEADTLRVRTMREMGDEVGATRLQEQIDARRRQRSADARVGEILPQTPNQPNKTVAQREEELRNRIAAAEAGQRTERPVVPEAVYAPLDATGEALFSENGENERQVLNQNDINAAKARLAQYEAEERKLRELKSLLKDVEAVRAAQAEAEKQRQNLAAAQALNFALKFNVFPARSPGDFKDQAADALDQAIGFDPYLGSNSRETQRAIRDQEQEARDARRRSADRLENRVAYEEDVTYRRAAATGDTATTKKIERTRLERRLREMGFGDGEVARLADAEASLGMPDLAAGGGMAGAVFSQRTGLDAARDINAGLGPVEAIGRDVKDIANSLKNNPPLRAK